MSANKYRPDSVHRYRNESISSTEVFLQSEIRTESSTRISVPKMTSSTSSVSASSAQQPHGTRVLKCFCGCTQLTELQIENFAMMNVRGLVNHQQGNNLLKTFLKLGHKNDKSRALISVECYEMCNRILNNIDSRSQLLDDLLELVPSYAWEEKLSSANSSGEMSSILRELQTECLNEIQSHAEFDRFRRELLRKIGK